MARRQGGIFFHWQVLVFALFMVAMPVSLHLLRVDRTPAYPVRIVLPSAAPYEPGARTPPGSHALPIAFDLSGPSGDSRESTRPTPIEARKPVRVNGADAGTVSVQVGFDSNLSLKREELRRLLAEAGQGALANALGAREFITFSESMRLGINVRYDAASDSIVISI